MFFHQNFNLRLYIAPEQAPPDLDGFEEEGPAARVGVGEVEEKFSCNIKRQNILEISNFHVQFGTKLNTYVNYLELFRHFVFIGQRT